MTPVPVKLNPPSVSKARGRDPAPTIVIPSEIEIEENANTAMEPVGSRTPDIVEPSGRVRVGVRPLVENE
jgi:hypothetical protein